MHGAFGDVYVQVSCSSCPICKQPQPFADFEIIVQTSPLTNTTASIWMLSSVLVAGIQGQAVSTSRVSFILYFTLSS